MGQKLGSAADPMAVTEDMAARVGACRDVLWGRRVGGHCGRSMFDHEVISFAHGNGLRAPDSAVVAAGIRALLDQDRFPLERYSFLERYEPLEDLITTMMRREGFPDDHLASLCIDAGTTKLFVSFLMTVAGRGDVVLVAPTFYHGLVGWARLLGLGLQVVPTRPQEAYKLTYESLSQAWQTCMSTCGRAPRALAVFNPTQTGAIYSYAEMAEVAQFCVERQLMVIEDNVFARTRFDLDAPLAHLAEDGRMRDLVVSVDGCSKADGLANLRIGWAVGSPDLVARMEAIKTATTVGMPYVTLLMAEAALHLDEDNRRRDVAECQARAAAVTASIADANEGLDLPPVAGLRVLHQPEAGHSIMVDAGALGADGEPLAPLHHSLELAEHWLDRAAVAVSPLYSSALDGHEFRLNFASVQHTGRVGGGRWDYAALVDPRPQIASAAARQDLDSVVDLLREAERTVETRPMASVAPGLIREGLVERIASALQPRAPGFSLLTGAREAREVGMAPALNPSGGRPELAQSA